MDASEQIVETVQEFYRRMMAGDADGANALISRDPATLVIGSAGEWVQDQDALRTGRLGPGEGLIGGTSAVGYEQDGMGWFADDPTWVFADGSKAQMRMSAFLRREDGRWRIVHSHLSVAVPDDECTMLQMGWKDRSATRGASA